MQIQDDQKGMAAPAKVAALKQIQAEYGGTATRVQCERLLAALAIYPITTFEAMRHLDVYHCPARIMQLRKAGHDIITLWQSVITEAGERHRVGQYLLRKGAGHA